ncbi:fas apoptotic inhibitory molecule 1-like [Dendronephthya gigantea]|uniref:fas apoptotic inhibitory molecule 1-like n=1 Tax=Dendronephthya gigantea TaxID=151771 RepID=UPI00106AB1C1|nr:fas apoptotic inhibitory molecule 1-like [Dendronephthya gigantea]
MATDIVATWDVALSDGIHTVLFEHGTTTGKRVIVLDGVEILRRNWMFRLVGKEEFPIGRKTKATIRIEAVSGFSYEYTLDVNGKPLKKFTENRRKTAKVWRFIHGGVETRVVFEKNSMDVWCNGEVLETAGEFVDGGTETHFKLHNKYNAYIKAISSGKRRNGIIHTLFVEDQEIPETDMDV